MRFKYTDSDGPAHTSAHNVTFELGRFSEVTDPVAIAFFERNCYFEKEVKVEVKPGKAKRKSK